MENVQIPSRDGKPGRPFSQRRDPGYRTRVVGFAAGAAKLIWTEPEVVKSKSELGLLRSFRRAHTIVVSTPDRLRAYR
jgi:hypothetical protein